MPKQVFMRVQEVAAELGVLRLQDELTGNFSTKSSTECATRTKRRK